MIHPPVGSLKKVAATCSVTYSPGNFLINGSGV
jgi:hypothetical protein